MRKWKSGEVKQLAQNHKSSNVSAGRNLSDHWLKALLFTNEEKEGLEETCFVPGHSEPEG